MPINFDSLGPTELKSSDPSSWICADHFGGVQALVWGFYQHFPSTNMTTRSSYKRDLPAQPKSKVTLAFLQHSARQVRRGDVQVGYRVNDSYATYMWIWERPHNSPGPPLLRSNPGTAARLWKPRRCRSAATENSPAIRPARKRTSCWLH